MHNLIKYFTFGHYPNWMHDVMYPCQQLAALIDRMLPDSAEKEAGLRKLLEAKDCFVRAKLEKQVQDNPPL